MAMNLAVGTPLAEALTSAVHIKISELGWGTEDDASLAEYIVLMLVNGKTQDQIASELASDLLPDGEGTQEFARWLFEQANALSNGESSTGHRTDSQSIPSFPDQEAARNTGTAAGSQEAPEAYDADMGDVGGSAPGNAPTGPKRMMPSGRGGARGGRIMGQLNKAMDRTNDSVLHRTRGTDRINNHARDAPKGPRGLQTRNVRPGMQKALNGIGMPASGMNNMGMSNGGPGSQSIDADVTTATDGIYGNDGAAGKNDGTNHAWADPCLIEWIPAAVVEEGGGKFSHGPAKHDASGDTAMDTNGKPDADAAASSMDVESAQSSSDPFTTMCRFNLRCTNKTCPFVHQSPASPEGTTVDMSDTCTFGAACKNQKCVGRHPSPAQIRAHQSEEQCKFYPYCTNPNCPFKHPSMPMCRNGADCSVLHCKFTHLQTPCKYTPCMNARCPFKHAEGQRGSYTDKVWTADGSGKKEDTEHVSERKFVGDDGEEELIKPEEMKIEEIIT